MKFTINENMQELSADQERFFRNSKIRDRNGDLLVCYHGSENRFDTFDKGRIGTSSGASFGYGFYFSNDPSVAGNYGEVQEYFLNITNPFEYYAVDRDYIIDFLNKSGLDYDHEFVENYDYDELWDADFIDDFLVKAIRGTGVYHKFTDGVKKAGFDGILAEPEIVAFEPNQIKLTTNLHPTNSDKVTESFPKMISK